MTDKLTWYYLDSLPDADAIAQALREAGVKGIPRQSHFCPLARATGWVVYRCKRGNGDCLEEMTSAESTFTNEFDRGVYSDLEEVEP